MTRNKTASRRAKEKGLSKGWTWLLLAAALGGFALYVSSPGGAGNPEGGPSAASIPEGASLYERNCAPCHGVRGIGEDPARPRGGVKSNGVYLAPALNETGHMWHHPPDALFGMVKNGSPAPESPMRGWAGKMSDDEIRAVLAYLESIWPADLRERYDQTFRGK